MTSPTALADALRQALADREPLRAIILQRDYHAATGGYVEGTLQPGQSIGDWAAEICEQFVAARREELAAADVEAFHEPWQATPGGVIRDAKGLQVARVHLVDETFVASPGAQDAYARRVAACVSACEQVPTPTLEAVRSPEELAEALAYGGMKP